MVNVLTETQSGNDVLKIGLKILNIPIKIVFPHIKDASKVYVCVLEYAIIMQRTIDSTST